METPLWKPETCGMTAAGKSGLEHTRHHVRVLPLPARPTLPIGVSHAGIGSAGVSTARLDARVMIADAVGLAATAACLVRPARLGVLSCGRKPAS